MQRIHVPLAGDRYWFALSIASVFGANTGDYIAKYLHLGHAGGLLPLAVLLGIVFLVERRDSAVRQAYYWLAIIIVRTAATNIADFGAGDMKFGKIWLTVALAALLAAVLFFTPPSKPEETANPRAFTLPTTDARYWIAMLIAGTLGTVIGDMASFDMGLGTARASIILGCLLGLAVFVGRIGLFTNLWFYWLAVVTVRAAGTSFSDYLAHEVFGLPVSTLVTGIVFVATLLLWRERPLYRAPSNEAA